MLTEEPEADQVVYFIHDEQLSRCPEVEIRLKNGIVLRSIIDSGSEVNIISQKAFEWLSRHTDTPCRKYKISNGFW
jgi:hypothetical protein